jgi:hypothetical protein
MPDASELYRRIYGVTVAALIAVRIADRRRSIRNDGRGEHRRIAVPRKGGTSAAT